MRKISELEFYFRRIISQLTCILYIQYVSDVLKLLSALISLFPHHKQSFIKSYFIFFCWQPAWSACHVRFDILQIKNSRGDVLQCSHYVPIVSPEGKPLPCVIYCHGNRWLLGVTFCLASTLLFETFPLRL